MNGLSPRLIAITGGSGAGKSWLADRLQERIGANAMRLSLDDFYQDRSHLTLAQRKRINFDHIRAIDWPLVEKVLHDCLRGQPTQVPQYDFKQHTRIKRLQWLRPKPLILIDGLWLLYRAPIRKLFDLRIFIECPVSLRFDRRVQRDQIERGHSMAAIRKYFSAKVMPMHNRYVQPQIQWSDIVFRRTCKDSDVHHLARALQDSIDKLLPAEEWREYVRALAFFQKHP